MSSFLHYFRNLIRIIDISQFFWWEDIMEDQEIIHRVLDQHMVLQDQINFVSATMSDKDALLRLEKAQAELAVDFRRPLNERRTHLLESLKIVAQGMKNHYTFEEEMLPPLLGKLLTEALITEHNSLKIEMQKLIAAITDIDLKGLSLVDEASQEAVMNGFLKELRNKKLDHQKREDAVLATLERIIEKKDEY
jgi:hypothetical protein